MALLECGDCFYPSLISTIDAAQAERTLETYIFALDEAGVSVKTALEQAASRGVLVRVAADLLGSGRAVSKQLQREFTNAGVGFRTFNPWFHRCVTRSHRKLGVIYREIAFIGGININDDLFSDNYACQALLAPRWDFAVRVEGQMVAIMQHEVELQ